MVNSRLPSVTSNGTYSHVSAAHTYINTRTPTTISWWSQPQSQYSTTGLLSQSSARTSTSWGSTRLHPGSTASSDLNPRVASQYSSQMQSRSLVSTSSDLYSRIATHKSSDHQYISHRMQQKSQPRPIRVSTQPAQSRIVQDNLTYMDQPGALDAVMEYIHRFSGYI